MIRNCPKCLQEFVGPLQKKFCSRKCSEEAWRIKTNWSQKAGIKSRQANPVRYLLRQAKYRAKKRNIEFTISMEDIEVPTHCPVFGFKLETTKGRRAYNSFSLDRFDNSKGYVKGNVKVVSWKANQYKGDLSLEEIEKLYNYMKGQ